MTDIHNINIIIIYVMIFTSLSLAQLYQKRSHISIWLQEKKQEGISQKIFLLNLEEKSPAQVLQNQIAQQMRYALVKRIREINKPSYESYES